MNMSGKWRKIEKFLDAMSKESPAGTQSFRNFMQKTEGDPSPDLKTRGLTSIGIPVSAQCEWCIAFHARAALEAGATEDEVMSAGFVAVLMHGGPAPMYMMRPADALEEFASGDVGGSRRAIPHVPAAWLPALARPAPRVHDGRAYRVGISRRSPC